MGTLEIGKETSDPAKVTVPHTAKRKAAQALLEASLEQSIAVAQTGRPPGHTPDAPSNSPLCSLAKRQRRSSPPFDLPFAKHHHNTSQASGPRWQTVCRSLTSCEVSLLASPDATHPQQLSLTQQGVVVVLVDRSAQTAAAVALLRASMQDPQLGLDVEWKADTFPTTNNPVSLLQIASTTCCLLVRICTMGYRLPPELLQLFRWESSNTTRMTPGCNSSVQITPVEMP